MMEATLLFIIKFCMWTILVISFALAVVYIITSASRANPKKTRIKHNLDKMQLAQMGDTVVERVGARPNGIFIPRYHPKQSWATQRRIAKKRRVSAAKMPK